MSSTMDPEELEQDIATCEPCARSICGERVKPDMACDACVSRVRARYVERAARAASRPTPPEPVDFSFVPEHQKPMHERLDNWGRAQIGSGSDSGAPMFRQHQSPQHWAAGYGKDVIVPVDRGDASSIGRGVYYLPKPHMQALQWYYVQRTSVMQGRKALGATAEHLARLVIDGRQMLINRGV